MECFLSVAQLWSCTHFISRCHVKITSTHVLLTVDTDCKGHASHLGRVAGSSWSTALVVHCQIGSLLLWWLGLKFQSNRVFSVLVVSNLHFCAVNINHGFYLRYVCKQKKRLRVLPPNRVNRYFKTFSFLLNYLSFVLNSRKNSTEKLMNEWMNGRIEKCCEERAVKA